ncbi:UDP-galactopyranose mutase [Raoultella ornithinolytica]|uniref:UDP-galactopyranose mutase n=1 Tax=Raoultella ornithinolytica TaxID=54291 RepID=UPI0015D6BF37|nr:UDP-galactopyranose mutase [Raoultella ornithinolytica]MDS0887236.1 UDP-galactopyranose mutase [Raoultella ornithinolytica]MEB6460036.1 UDP-galactopyranose mutase [Raoultella ornithinolytica]QLJ45817.1 UDP-galactopyranose mutase [Raoultella ornithinolytica]QXW35830.1 UDP-galactopyranose mutase [Raoultella ornithinolytica]HEC2568575.1 UDP-galactopyranose mutase [Raoultella ornithinolytica]
MKYDFLIVGAGLFGATFAYEAKKKGKKCLVIDKRSHVAGNIYTKQVNGINIHQYGAHIFHTNDKFIWDYVQQFAEFNRYTNSPIAKFGDEIYNLPFNMNTFNKLWGVVTPKQAKEKIAEQVINENISNPQNLEEQAISLVGRDIYEKLIKGYTEKQWGRQATEIPAFIIKRLPVRFTYDNNYFRDKYQGIPIGGYTQIVEKMLDGIEVLLDTDFFEDKEYYLNIADSVVFTGMIDQYYDYCYGTLEYRSLKFDTHELEFENFQGNAVVNYTEYQIPYTRIIEHKHFEFGEQDNTIITYEYPSDWRKGDEPYYPINDNKNNELYQKYLLLSQQEEKIIFGGRLGMYKYFDMHNVIAEALDCANKNIK